MPPTTILLALLLDYILQQFLHTVTPMILDPSMIHHKPRIFSMLDSVFLLTIWACSSSELCRQKAQELFWLGMLGIGHVAFSYVVVGTKSLFFLFSLVVFIAIGPLHSICLIVEKAMPQNKFCNITLSYLGLVAVTIHHVPQAKLYAVLMFGTAYCMHLIGGRFELDLVGEECGEQNQKASSQQQNQQSQRHQMRRRRGM